MGAWGTSLYANDTACDLRGDYVEKLRNGKSDNDATQELIAQWTDTLGDSEEAFSPLLANNKMIKATSALPITAKAFKEHNVQFCFGDVADISFLASIFNTASKSGIEIEFVLHLAAVKKGRQVALMGDGTANLLEVCRAYWQSNPETFKGFFYAAGEGDIIRKFSQKDGFPVKFYKLRSSFAENKESEVPSENLYRLFTPVDMPILKKYQSKSVGKKASVSDNTYIKDLSQAIGRLLNSI